MMTTSQSGYIQEDVQEDLDNDAGDEADRSIASDAEVEEALGRNIFSPELPPLYRRAWLLTLVSLSERHAVTPLAQGDLHMLAYLANALAPVYSLDAPDRAILKAPGGPFFPAVQWDIDRLSAQHLVELVDLETIRTDGGFRVNVNYACSPAGQDIVHRLLEAPRLVSAYPYLGEVVGALASNEAVDQQTIEYADPTYALDVPLGSIIDYGEWDDPRSNNFSFRTSAAFEAANARGLPFSPRERVHLYLRYLRRARQKVS